MELFDDYNKYMLGIKEASLWASEKFNRNITTTNIQYLINYGRIKRYCNNGEIQVKKEELEKYYDSYLGKREVSWKNELGHDLNWNLSFDFLREKDTTKHVHRLHPYKGKFIPQLVEYFIDSHTDDFKTKAYFKPGDIILDPFCGSGTTLVQANESRINAIGVDVSHFNCEISNSKIDDYDFQDIKKELNRLTRVLRKHNQESNSDVFEQTLLEVLNRFNSQYYPSPEFKIRIREENINENEYAESIIGIIREKYNELLNKFKMDIEQNTEGRFLDKWYLKPIREEIEILNQHISDITNSTTKRIIKIILSRTIRSCRATTHSDLATLKEPMKTVYYCRKHKKICKPLFSLIGWWERYAKDTVNRLIEFQKLKSKTKQLCLNGDSRSLNIIEEVEKKDSEFAKMIDKEGISGIFSSPPYVGLIDYHEQHAYAYDLFGIERKDEFEIGPLYRGQGRAARESYIQGISEVLKNSKRFMKENYDVFLVANDKYNLYPKIAEKANMKIIRKYK